MIVVSAPSGSGKTTIVKAMLAADMKLEFSVSACSRQPRINEQHGRDYYFLSVAEFRKKIAEDAFIEWEEVYPGNYYGTLKSEVQRIWNNGNHAIFDVDVIGGLNIKKKYPGGCLALFIRPPSIAVLEKRLRHRSTDQEETIRKRIEKAEYELSFAPRFDRIIINDELRTAIAETKRVIAEFINP